MNIKRTRLEATAPASATLRAQAPQWRRGCADTLRGAAAVFNPQALRAASLTRDLAAAFVAGMAVALARYTPSSARSPRGVPRLNDAANYDTG
jgi:hypothetical protein